MSSTITTPTTTYTATLVDGYKAERATRNTIADILGSNDKAVSFRPAALRTGTLRLLFEDYTTAAALHADLSTIQAPATFADTDRPGLGMTFVPVDRIGFELDDATRGLWWVEIAFQEVTT